MSLQDIAKYAKIKGLNLVGTGDFTHPMWLKEIREVLNAGVNGKRNEFLFLLLMNTALRISDALTLKVSMVKGKDYLELKEKKTGKPKKFIMNAFLNVINT
jgi:PHP family Zn ribbon phosphoesterase